MVTFSSLFCLCVCLKRKIQAVSWFFFSGKLQVIHLHSLSYSSQRSLSHPCGEDDSSILAWKQSTVLLWAARVQPVLTSSKKIRKSGNWISESPRLLLNSITAALECTRPCKGEFSEDTQAVLLTIQRMDAEIRFFFILLQRQKGVHRTAVPSDDRLTFLINCDVSPYCR